MVGARVDEHYGGAPAPPPPLDLLFLILRLAIPRPHRKELKFLGASHPLVVSGDRKSKYRLNQVQKHTDESGLSFSVKMTWYSYNIPLYFLS